MGYADACGWVVCWWRWFGSFDCHSRKSLDQQICLQLPFVAVCLIIF
jgi:hypothetical protein